MIWLDAHVAFLPVATLGEGYLVFGFDTQDWHGVNAEGAVTTKSTGGLALIKDGQ